MYGDGEYVVTFESGAGTQAPLKAFVLCPSGRRYTAQPGEQKQSTKLAASIIAAVRRAEVAA